MRHPVFFNIVGGGFWILQVLKCSPPRCRPITSLCSVPPCRRANSYILPDQRGLTPRRQAYWTEASPANRIHVDVRFSRRRDGNVPRKRPSLAVCGEDASLLWGRQAAPTVPCAQEPHSSITNPSLTQAELSPALREWRRCWPCPHCNDSGSIWNSGQPTKADLQRKWFQLRIFTSVSQQCKAHSNLYL